VFRDGGTRMLKNGAKRAISNRRSQLRIKSRRIVALGMAAVLACTGVAIAGDTGADLNDAQVLGGVQPKKLSKKKFKPVNLYLGVQNSPNSTGNENANAASERILTSKNIKVDLSKAPRCTDYDTVNPSGTTTEDARDNCPAGSYLGGGEAVIHAPTAACGPGATEPCVAFTPVVSVFNGPGQGELRLHTYDPELGPGSPGVEAAIVKATKSEKKKGFAQALDVPFAPTTGALKITKFDATVDKGTKVATAKCKPKKFKVTRRVVYKDGSSESVSKSQKCKVKRRR
jgi:hypothetical protein